MKYSLQKALKKESKDLAPEEKELIQKNWDILNDDLRVKFADVAPEGGDADEDEEEEEEEGDGSLDEKALDALLDQKTRAATEKQAEKIAVNLVKMLGENIDKHRAKFLEDGKPAENKSRENDELTRQFIHALKANDTKTLKELGKRKAMTTEDDDDAKAGYLIPEPLANEVIRITQEGYGVARREFAYNLLTEGNTKRITALGSALSVFWVDEKGKKPASTPSFSIVELALKKLAVIVPMTEEVVEDSGVNLTELVGTLIREAIDKEVDLQFFNGDGTVWTGLLNDTTIPKDTLAATKYAAAIRPEDIMGLADNTALSVNGKYYMHRTILTKIRTLRQNADGTGEYIYNPIGGASEPYGTLNGRPVVLVEAMPTYTVANAADKPIMLYGDLKAGVAYGEKSSVKIKLLDQATITDVDGETVLNLAEQDMIGVRAVQRVGMKVTLASAMRRLVSGPAS